jgi:hypothetical protein
MIKRIKLLVFIVIISILPKSTLASNNVFDPKDEQIFLIFFNDVKKTIHDGCKQPWHSQNHLIERVGLAKNGSKRTLGHGYKLIKSDKYCDTYRHEEDKSGDGTVECNDTVLFESKDHIVLNPNKILLGGSNRQIIAAGKSVCIKLLRDKLLNGYELE